MSLRKFKEKFASLSQPAKASLVFVVANIFQKGINFLMAPVNTRILESKDYGVVSLYDTWYAIISVVALLSLYEAVYGVGLTEFKNDRDVFTFSLLVLSNIATLLCSLIYVINPAWVRSALKLSDKLIMLMIIALLLYPALYFWTIRQRFEYKYKASATITISTSVMMSICSVIAVLTTKGNKAEAKVITNFAVICPVLVTLYIYIVTKAKFKLKVKYWWYSLKFTIPLIPHYLSLYLLDGSDKVIITKLIDSSATGIYEIACKFNSILIVIWNAINATLIPWTYECLEKKKYSDIKKVTTLIVLLTGGLCTCVSLVAPEAVKIIASKGYYDAVYAIPPLTMGLFLESIYYMFSNVEFYHKSTVFAMISTIVAATVNIGLNFLLIPKFGFVVAAYTTLFGYVIQTILHYINMRRCEKESVFNISFIVRYSLIIITFNILLTRIYPYTVVRYVLVLTLAVVAYIKRKELIHLFKTIKNK
ncbi:MAG: oligosaccharide flippase family protein [Lachnospiraceae bacterium]|nr:oligosaccharide flippase family protein [Lachnospiraceae bacterium]